MNRIVFLYAPQSINYALESVFNGECSLVRAVRWACKYSEKNIQLIVTDQNKEILAEKLLSFKNQIDYLILNENKVSSLINLINDRCKLLNGEYVIYSWADCPLLSSNLTDELIHDHVAYEAEYTYADGYPEGVSPEIIDAGALNIIASLSVGVQKRVGDKEVCRDAFFSVMSGDINAFEIETVISSVDYRLLRLNLNCETKLNYLTCKNVFDQALKCGIEISIDGGYNPYLLFNSITDCVDVLHIIPSFYNIQLTTDYNHYSIYNPYCVFFDKDEHNVFDLEDFKLIVKKIADFSDTAVVSLSLWGEPLLVNNLHDYVGEILRYKNLSVFIETDGLNITDALVNKLYDIGKDRIDWAVCLDASDCKMYSKVNNAPEADFEKAIKGIGELCSKFKGHVYPQMTRCTVNEEQLETFYRYWHDDSSLSGGKLVIQKYNSFCKALEDLRSADISPVSRNVCWHLRRDMCILCNGSVVLCRETGKEFIVGNAITQTMEQIWAEYSSEIKNHIDSCYSEKCRACDEYYTFNF